MAGVGPGEVRVSKESVVEDTETDLGRESGEKWALCLRVNVWAGCDFGDCGRFGGGFLYALLTHGREGTHCWSSRVQCSRRSITSSINELSFSLRTESSVRVNSNVEVSPA